MNNKTLILIFSFLPVVAFGATMYKWQDEAGITHYAETPPTKYKAKAIQLQPASPANAEKALPAEKTWQQQDLEFRKRRAERQEAEKRQEEKEAAIKQEAATRKQNCKLAWQNLQTLRTRKAVYALDEKGEPEYFDDARRSAEIEKAKQEIQLFCAPQ
jgi:Domain of unknown function (DUF4124)